MRVLNIESCKPEELTTILDKPLLQENPEVEATVRAIIRDVKRRGDEAVLEYTRKFDWPNADAIALSKSEINRLAEQVPEKLLAAIKAAKENIERFHLKQIQQTWFDSEKPGVLLGQVINPVERAGIHVPAFAAPLPSSLLMSAIPAKVAGVREIYVATPPRRDGTIHPSVAAAALISEVDAVFRMGGAQAVAALAYGTQTIPKVDVIVGPGNIYATMAKRFVFGQVGIDMLAGPSEVLVIADESANPRYVAADMLSQAEHQTDARSILVTTSTHIANEVKSELERQLQLLSRGKTAKKSIEENGAIIIVPSIEKAIEVANRVAPEHLELMVKDARQYLNLIKNAGAIFIGEYSTEPIGDYIAGPSHVLPTSGTARFSSPLTVADFVKVSSVIMYSKESLEAEGPTAIELAEAEG
ncbi:MAG: histidinol dehydrogenase, partial [Armatimonadota bacterium]|nr:histidinol dehydrogenase [Armatimonadota bacterium]